VYSIKLSLEPTPLLPLGDPIIDCWPDPKAPNPGDCTGVDAGNKRKYYFHAWLFS